jgi:general secretion pathway protein C
VSAAAWYEELKSGPGWTRLLAQRGPQLAVGALVVVLAIDCALILTRSLSAGSVAPARSTVVRPVSVRPAVNPTLELANIVNAHLFGVAGVQSGGNAPQTTMPLILAGVIADKDPTKGQAIIGETAVAAKLVAVGAMIPGGVRLNSVYGDRVLIERNGRLETLLLPRTPAKTAAPSATPLNIGAQPNTLRDNATVLAGLVRVQPVFSQGKLTGYRIFPGGTHGPSAFNQLGLRAGDLILAVNGTSLDDATRAMEVLQTLSSSASATVTVSRNGQSQDVNLNLATLSTDADTPAADNSGAAAGAQQPGAAGTGPARVRGFNPPSPETPAATAGAPGMNAAPAPSDAPPGNGVPNSAASGAAAASSGQ